MLPTPTRLRLLVRAAALILGFVLVAVLIQTLRRDGPGALAGWRAPRVHWGFVALAIGCGFAGHGVYLIGWRRLLAASGTPVHCRSGHWCLTKQRVQAITMALCSSACVVTGCSRGRRTPVDSGWTIPALPPPDSGPLTRQQSLFYLQRAYEGVSSLPIELRQRVARDSVALATYADLLMGRAPWPPGAAPDYALFWITLARDPRFAPVFLHLTDSAATADFAEKGFDRGGLLYHNAVAALGQVTAAPEARERLISLSRERSSVVRTTVAGTLMVCPDSAWAKGVLRTMLQDSLPPPLRQQIRRYLLTGKRPFEK